MSMKAITKTILVFAAIGGVISGCVTKSEFKDLEERMDVLESNKIQSIEGQISSIDTSIGLLDQTDDQLEGYINALKEQVLELESDCGEDRETLETAIKALQTEDESLHKRIDELKYYTDSTLTDAKDWVKATIETLEEEYSKTVDVIAGIKANVDTLHTSITKEYQDAIEDAIGKSAESMKLWVNEQLTGYYDIATMNTKLDSLKSALGKQISEQGDDLKELIGQNTKDIETLESDLKQAKTDITDAYKKAIEEAITKYDGTITKTIQKEIDDVNTKIGALDDRVTDIETAVSDLEKRLAEAERTLKNLASITHIPEYTDGIEIVEYSLSGVNAKANLTLRFDVYPADYADSILTAYNKNNSIISARAVYTLTKATAGEFVNFKISSVKAEKDDDGVSTGVLDVVVSSDNLGYEFLTGALEASVVVKITTDYSNIQSDYIRLKPGGEGLTFIKYLFINYDEDKDGVLDTTTDQMESLDFSGAGLTSLDLSSNGFWKLKTLNICDNPDLSELYIKNTKIEKVICSSLEAILNCKIDANNVENISFYTPDAKLINLEDYDVEIDNTVWKRFNVGAKIGSIAGKQMTFEEASKTDGTACPDGYCLPTIEQIKSLIANQSKFDWKWHHGAYGKWYSGSQTYSSETPAVFFTYGNGIEASYWSCTESSSENVYTLVINTMEEYSERYKDKVTETSKTSTCLVRCVKK